MYIEFTLPTGAGGQVAAYVNSLLNKELHIWADKYNIPYHTKIHKYTKRVTFDADETYSFFALTWSPISKDFRSYLLEYRLIEPMNLL